MSNFPKDLTNDLEKFQVSVETITLKRKQIEEALKISKQATESRQWQIYLQNLALAAFKEWLQKREGDIFIEHISATARTEYANIIDAVCNLKVGNFKICLIPTLLPTSKKVFLPKAVVDLPEFTAHFYVVINIQQELKSAVISGFMRYDELMNYRSKLKTKSNCNYEIDLGLFKHKSDDLLLYLKILAPIAIPLPKIPINSLSNLPKLLNTLLILLAPSNNRLFWEVLTWEQGVAVLTTPGLVEWIYKPLNLNKIAFIKHISDLLQIFDQQFVKNDFLSTITRKARELQTTLLLAGEIISTTKTILRLVEISDSRELRIFFEETYCTIDFPDLVPLVQEFLVKAKSPTPQKACFTIARPVFENSSKLTNSIWELEEEQLEQELGIPQVLLLNDFEAIGYAIKTLQKQDLFTLQAGKSKPEGTIGIIGAVKGLGQALLSKQGTDYQVLPSEGGHADFCCHNKLEFELLEYLRHQHNTEHISVERVVSEQGIVSIYQFLRDRKDAPIPESSDIAKIIRTWEEEAEQLKKSVDPVEAIIEAALQKSDCLSEQTMQLFIEAYGAAVGNFALHSPPYGGLYIAGEIAPKILPLIENSSFLLNLIQKGRMHSHLYEIPVHIILKPQVALIGAALYAAMS